MSEKSSNLAAIEGCKQQLHELLQQVTLDDSLLNGVLNFARGKVLQLILNDLNTTLGLVQGSRPAGDDLPLAQRPPVKIPPEETAETMVDRVWTDFYHPVFKYYSTQHQQLAQYYTKKGKRRPVELRKLNERFRKTAKMTRDFFFGLLKHILTQHNLGPMIPDLFYEHLGLQLADDAFHVPMKNQEAIVKIVYVCHRCMFFMGATSRYRSTLSLHLTPDNQEDFNKAMEMFHFAELLLPAFGETRNQMGMIYNTQNDKTLAAYEFMRSSKARIPSNLGTKNFQAILKSSGPIMDKLNQLRIQAKPTLQTRREFISVYFLSIYGYLVSPSSWAGEDGFLLNGTSVEELENDFIKFTRPLAFEGDVTFFWEKMLLMLISGVTSLEPRKGGQISAECKNILRFTLKYIIHLEDIFVELWGSNDKRSTALKLLPFLRIVFSWLKVSKIAIQYAHRNFHFIVSTARLVNLILKELEDEQIAKRPKREQYFKEDVGVKEFTPINRMLYDFDDDHMFRDEESQSRLIGAYTDSNAAEEDALRLIAVTYMAKKVLLARPQGVEFVAEKKEIKLDDDITKGYEKHKAKELQKSKASTPASNSKKPQKKEVKKPSPPPQAKKLQKRQKSPQVTSDSDDSDVESMDEEVFNRKKFEALKISGNKAPLEKATLPLPTLLTSDDLEDHILTQRNEQYTSMVDSLVDDAFTTTSVAALAKVAQVTGSQESNWNANAVGTATTAPANYNTAFPAYGQPFSPYNAQNPAFPSYQNYYPLYPSGLQGQQPGQQPQQQPQQASLQQLAGIYGQQTHQAYPQYSPYGMYQQPQAKENENEKQKSSSPYPPGKYYPYGM